VATGAFKWIANVAMRGTESGYPVLNRGHVCVRFESDNWAPAARVRECRASPSGAAQRKLVIRQRFCRNRVRCAYQKRCLAPVSSACVEMCGARVKRCAGFASAPYRTIFVLVFSGAAWRSPARGCVFTVQRVLACSWAGRRTAATVAARPAGCVLHSGARWGWCGQRGAKVGVYVVGVCVRAQCVQVAKGAAPSEGRCGRR